MEINFLKRDDNTAEIFVSGKVDANTSPELEKRVLEYVARFSSLIINMADCNYMSSAGIRVVKRIYIAMNAKKGNLQFVNVNDTVYEVLNMTGMARFLNIVKA